MCGRGIGGKALGVVPSAVAETETISVCVQWDETGSGQAERPRKKLSLPAAITFGDLADKISTETGLNKDRLKFFVGFPPVQLFGAFDTKITEIGIIDGVLIIAKEGATTSVKSVSMFRLASGNESDECSICANSEELVGTSADDIRLGCRCLFHIECYIRYVKMKLGDKHALRRAGVPGIACPNAGQFGSCKFRGPGDSGFYFLTANDLDKLVTYSTETLHTAGAADFSHEDVEKIRSFLQSDGPGPAVVQRAATNDTASLSLSGIQHTSKKCPNPSCNNRETHYHGHECHHNKYGCGEVIVLFSFYSAQLTSKVIYKIFLYPSQCSTQYCYKCLKTADENRRERGQDSSCLCGGWSNFCCNLKSTTSIEKYLIKTPYPYDVRCGCAICNECKFDDPCGTCDGACSVCEGFLNPGPIDFGVPYIAQTEEMTQKVQICCKLKYFSHLSLLFYYDYPF